MFKKNPSRPDLNVALKKTSQGYRIVQNESFQLFTTKKIVRSIYRPDLIQMSNQHIQGVGNSGGMASGTMIQPPAHVTLPAVAFWFKQDQVHQIQKDYFPQYFRPDIDSEIFSFAVKNSNLYMYYRNSMISMWRENAKKYLSPSLCRKNLLGDVSSIMRIHAFLENWGLVNFPSKQHNKGILIEKPENLACCVCEASDSSAFYVAQIQDVFFQICQHCFQNDCYPLSIKKAEFRKILYQNHVHGQKQLDKIQIIRMLQIMNGIPNGVTKDKDRDTWSLIQKQFPEMSKEKILKSFLKIPLNVQMNSHIFQNNEDYLTFQNPQIKKQIEQITQPSVFQDFQNPILGSIAHMCYLINKHNTLQRQGYVCDGSQQQTLRFECAQNKEQLQTVQFYRKLLHAAEQHSERLCWNQEQKIKDLAKMLIQVVISRLQLKSLFISEYQKLVKSEQDITKNLIKNNLAQCLKQNFRQIYSQQNNPNESQNQKSMNGSQPNQNIDKKLSDKQLYIEHDDQL